MKGDVAAALAEFRDQYDAGADPAAILTDLAEFTHLVTRLKFRAGGGATTLRVSEDERGAAAGFRRSAVDARAVARLADAAQGHPRGAGSPNRPSAPPKWC